MNVQLNNSEQLGDFLQKLSTLHDPLVKVAKSASLIGAVCGFMYLLTFTIQTGIPFPLELSVLPTTLLIVGLTSLFASFIVIAGMLVPALTVDEFDVTGGFFKALDCIDNAWRVRAKRYFLWTWGPMALALSGFMLLTGIVAEQTAVKVLGFMLMASSACWIFFTPRLLRRFEEKRWLYFLSTYGQIAMATFAYLMTIVVLIAMIPEIKVWMVWEVVLLALVVFSPIHAMVSIPIFKGGDSKILRPPFFGRETVPAVKIALVLASCWTLGSVVLPQMSSKVGGAVLRVFHVGGGIPVQICLKSKPADRIAKRFHFDDDACSAKLWAQLDIGDRMYVSTLQDAVGDVVYFRQDDIRQKIFLKPASQSPAE